MDDTEQHFWRHPLFLIMPSSLMKSCNRVMGENKWCSTKLAKLDNILSAPAASPTWAWSWALNLKAELLNESIIALDAFSSATVSRIVLGCLSKSGLDCLRNVQYSNAFQKMFKSLKHMSFSLWRINVCGPLHAESACSLFMLLCVKCRVWIRCVHFNLQSSLFSWHSSC